ncbi:MAG: sigma-70 family RNA polymerase sigma factor, partial [Acidobacteriota bacterium]|nr:sigma-70 family RNA polymerase sigma factor [Acidobacteriota bacterium]
MFSPSWAATMPLTSETNTGDADARLLEACRDGDGDAFGELVRRHQQRVFRLAGRFFRRPEEVEDVAQETFLTAWRKLHTYRAEAPFEHWLTRVCLNTCYAHFRGRRAKPALETELDPDLASVSPDPTLRIDVNRLLSTLSPADRFVLMMMYGEGWSVAEIADNLGWSKSNVKVRLFRARK